MKKVTFVDQKDESLVDKYNRVLIENKQLKEMLVKERNAHREVVIQFNGLIDELARIKHKSDI